MRILLFRLAANKLPTVSGLSELSRWMLGAKLADARSFRVCNWQEDEQNRRSHNGRDDFDVPDTSDNIFGFSCLISQVKVL